MAEADIEKLRALGKRFLSEDGQVRLEIDLEDREIDTAQAFLLGVIDRWYFIKRAITEEEAKAAYAELGLTPEEAANIRNTSRFWRKMDAPPPFFGE